MRGKRKIQDYNFTEIIDWGGHEKLPMDERAERHEKEKREERDRR